MLYLHTLETGTSLRALYFYEFSLLAYGFIFGLHFSNLCFFQLLCLMCFMCFTLNMNGHFII